jgi:ribosome biogenesis protein MAK21
VLYLISELESTFPNIKKMMTEPEVDVDDEEEHFVDVLEEGDEKDAQPESRQPPSNELQYDPKKRDPEHAHAERSCLWDLLPFLQHFHPSVALFAESLLFNKSMPAKPDPTQHTLIHFLDRFVYRSARSRANASMHGSSIMQPMAGSNAADLLVKPSKEGGVRGDVNSEAFWQKKVEDVAADEVFFHSYFNQAGNKRRKGSEKKVKKADAEADDDASDEEGEEEI